MKKPEFKDIAGYLPYGLKLGLNHEGKFNLDEEYPNTHNEICMITNICYADNGNIEIEISDNDWSCGYIELSEIEIYLRPMSDLTKPIKHNGYNNGEEFRPIEILMPRYFEFHKWDNERHSITIVNETIQLRRFAKSINDYGIEANRAMTRTVIDLLNQWMFDYRGLIDQGLAIDVNTLDQKIYE